MVEDRLSTRITIKFNQCNNSIKICELSQSLLLFPFCSSNKKNLLSFLPLFHLLFCILFTKLVFLYYLQMQDILHSQIEVYIHKLAILHFPIRDLLCACISQLEIYLSTKWTKVAPVPNIQINF